MAEENPGPSKKMRKLFLDPESSQIVSRTTEWRWKHSTHTQGITVQNQPTIHLEKHLSLEEPMSEFAELDSVESDCDVMGREKHLLDSSNGSTGNDLSEICNKTFSDTCSSISHDVMEAEDEMETEEFPENIDETTTENTIYDDSVIRFENEMTRKDISLMLVGLSYRHSLSKEAMVDIIKLIDALAGKKTGLTNYFIEKQSLPPDEVVQYNFYCKNCQSSISQVTKSSRIHQNVICQQCETMNVLSPLSDNYFITLDLHYQFKKFLEDVKIQVILSNYEKKYINSSISDITDSELYQASKKKYNFDFSFNFNTDGAPIFHSSKLSMWPIQLAVNELPPEQRHRNIILAGIWFGKSEPKMNVFLNVFADNCIIIANEGVCWKLDNESKTSRIFPLFCCVDSVARPMIQNSTQFNGFFGCSYCYHPGKVINKQVKYSSDVQPYNLRSSDDVLKHMQEAVISGRRVFGIKGSAAIINLPGFDLVWGYPIDYMHMVLLGVVRQCWEIWTTYGNEMYIGSPSTLKLVNDRLLKIHPPNEIHRTPRPLSEKAKWKASEWRSWLLFYSIPCLRGILGNKYLVHFSLLQRSIYLLLKREITANDITLAEGLLKIYVSKFEIYYGSSAMNFNVHLLTHLAICVNKCGPLWSTSNFHFESAIFNIKRTVKGPMGIDKQIIYKSFSKNIVRYTDMSATCKTYLNDIARYELPGTLQNNIRILGAGSKERIEDIYVTVYNRVIINNTLYSSSNYCENKKNNNSCVQLIDGHFAIILKIYKLNESIKLRVQKMNCDLFFIHENSVENCWVVDNVQCKEVIDISQISEKVLLMKVDGTSYVSKFPNHVEIQ
ncbi:unnamed protein product [Phaedon cochleariae]|uniref:Transposase domain-containing protein n=1 Tax=Phaedon cochleariae TaxID=80249 RepID=A0A9P0GQX5_PHACE|nr:unnamed protein product [Phaedon cochleariae]